jgi:uncharacterized protein (TIGR00661 family)
MRILYGVHGYGVGHTARAGSVLPSLSARHQILVVAGGQARTELEKSYSVFPVPSFEFRHRRGRLSTLATVRANLPLALDALFGGARRALVGELLAAFKPDLVISDSEPYTLRAAARAGIPRIGFDHSGALAFCRPPVPPGRALHLACAGAVYRGLMGEADRLVVSAFYDVEPARDGVVRVGPLVRPEVKRARPRTGDHLLVYLNRGAHEYDERVELALRSLDRPCIVYGAPRNETEGRITHRRVDDPRFVEELAMSCALLCTAGNQLIGEALYLGKPVLVMPEDSTEQHVNAVAVERLGVGEWILRRRLEPGVLRGFLERAEAYAARSRSLARDGTEEALAALERFMVELCGGGSSRRAA